ncbi:MAG: IPT/TIG domain-containing protein [Prevotellaceae bacterium]|jgi:hypothetical protein|nr:IPT/TIG domain-containing protein [Prevotellaceae bacterium]
MRVISKSYKAVTVVLLCLLTAGLVFQSCKKEDEGFRLDAFGPAGIERGGEIFFVGSGLDQVESIKLPDGSVYSRDQFTLEEGRITLLISPNYPLCPLGQIEMGLSNGTTFTTTSRFEVLYTPSVTDVAPVGSPENPLIPDQSVITVKGKVLGAVDSIVFNNGFKLDVEPQNDSVFTFILPKEASSGAFSLLVKPRCEGGVVTSAEGRGIFVLEPIISSIEVNCDCNCDGSSASVGSEIVIKGKDFWRIDNPDNALVFLNLTEATGKVNVEANELRVTLPYQTRVGESTSVSVMSNGKTISAPDVTFTVAPPKIDDVDLNGNVLVVKGCGLLAVDTDMPLQQKIRLERIRNGVKDTTFATRLNVLPPTAGEIQFRFGNVTGAKTLMLGLRSGQTVTYEFPE